MSARVMKDRRKDRAVVRRARRKKGARPASSSPRRCPDLRISASPGLRVAATVHRSPASSDVAAAAVAAAAVTAVVAAVRPAACGVICGFGALGLERRQLLLELRVLRLCHRRCRAASRAAPSRHASVITPPYQNQIPLLVSLLISQYRTTEVSQYPSAAVPHHAVSEYCMTAPQFQN